VVFEDLGSFTNNWNSGSETGTRTSVPGTESLFDEYQLLTNTRRQRRSRLILWASSLVSGNLWSTNTETNLLGR
jgi:hypothetical protein